MHTTLRYPQPFSTQFFVYLSRFSVAMAGGRVTVPGLPLVPPDAAAPVQAAGTTPGVTTPAPARTVDRGGTPENRWEYDRNTQLYTRWWAVSYAGLYFDGQRTRPVRWTLEDMQRTVIDDFVVYKETWSWVYLQ